MKSNYCCTKRLRIILVLIFCTFVDRKLASPLVHTETFVHLPLLELYHSPIVYLYASYFHHMVQQTSQLIQFCLDAQDCLSLFPAHWFLLPLWLDLMYPVLKCVTACVFYCEGDTLYDLLTLFAVFRHFEGLKVSRIPSITQGFLLYPMCVLPLCWVLQVGLRPALEKIQADGWHLHTQAETAPSV